MRRLVLLSSFLALVAGSMAPAPAAAQEGVDWGGLMAGIAHGTAMDEAAQESVTPKRRGGGRATTAAPLARLTYAPSIERRRRNLAQFVAKSRKHDPQGAAELEKLFASQDPVDQINRQMITYGFRANDLGDAYAAWWLNAWLASRARTDDPTRRQIAAVRAQAAQAIASLPQVVNADDAVKQEMAEAYLVQTALIGGHIEQAKDNPAQLKRVGAAVRQGARASSLDLGAMELTDNGFVPG
jgi:hypothetical protein